MRAAGFRLLTFFLLRRPICIKFFRYNFCTGMRSVRAIAFRTSSTYDPMKTLCFLFTLAGLFASFTGTSQSIQRTSVPVVNASHSRGDIGYFFSLRDVPLSQKQFIFLADPLKKAVYINGDRNIFLSHTMTVKTAKGFDMYFSANDYNVTLAVRDAHPIDDETIEYKGTLLIRHGSDKQKLAVHGFQNR